MEKEKVIELEEEMEETESTHLSIRKRERKTKKRTMRDIVRQKERKIEGLKEDRRRESGGLTGNSAEVEVVSDDLLVVVVH